MKLFGWVITRPEHAAPTVLERLERAENALHRLTKDVKELQVDWESVLDKIARYTARQAARSRRAIAESVDPPGNEAAATSGPTAETATPLTRPMPKAAIRAALANGSLRRLGG